MVKPLVGPLAASPERPTEEQEETPRRSKLKRRRHEGFASLHTEKPHLPSIIGFREPERKVQVIEAHVRSYATVSGPPFLLKYK